MREKALAAGGLLAAFAASTCCVLPLALASVGMGSTIAARFAVLAPYQTWFRVTAALLLGAGFWMVYACTPVMAEVGACAPGMTTAWTKPVLWSAAVLMALVFTSGWWERWVA